MRTAFPICAFFDKSEGMSVFRSYDIRGVFPSEIDTAFARNLGVALGRHFLNFPEHRGKSGLHLAVGRDMRRSAAECAPALIDGLRSAGHRVSDIGMVTTPCLYFGVQRVGADGGVMCTASHNPARYIGFKVCRELAIPIGYDAGLKDVEKMMGQPAPAVTAGKLETVDLDDAYIEFLTSQVKDVRPIVVAVDASNGMAGKYIEKLFSRFPVELDGFYLEPDGSFPHHEADPSKVANMREVGERARKIGGDIGFCLDGDGDRLGVVDEKGEPIRGDLLAALLARDALQSAPGSVAAYDLRSSKVLAEAIAEAGGRPLRSRVGHAHVKRLMAEQNAVFGSELSGHFYFQLRDRSTFYADSGLVALVRMLGIVSRAGKPISQLIAPLAKYSHTGEINFHINEAGAAIAAVRKEFSDGRQSELDGVSVEYASWWFNVRASNTEPLLRLTLEGDTPAIRDAGLDRVLAVLTRFGKRE
jgi:phosphomannomutase